MRRARAMRGPAVLAAALCLALVASPAPAGIYWTNGTSYSGPGGTSGSEIGRAALDGAHVERDWLPVGTSPRDLEVAGGRLYWPEAGRIASADARTGKVRRNHVVLPEHTCSDECDLVVLGAHVYWADSESEYVGRARLDGNGVDAEWLRVGHLARPHRLASDGSALFVSLRQDDQHSLWRVQPRDRQPTRLLARIRMEHVSALAAAGGSVYYSGFVTDDHGERRGRVGRVSTTGSGDDPAWFAQDTGAPDDPEWYPARIAVHGPHLYFTAEFSRDLGAGAVGRVRLDGGGTQPYLVTHRGDLFLPYGLAVDGTRVVPPATEPPVRRAKVAVAARQRLKGSPVRVRLRVTSGPGRIRSVVRGTVRGAGGKLRLTVRKRVVPAGKQARFNLALAAKGPRKRLQERRVRKTVRQGRVVRARVNVRLVDERGNQRRVTRVVRLLR